MQQDSRFSEFCYISCLITGIQHPSRPFSDPRSRGEKQSATGWPLRPYLRWHAFRGGRIGTCRHTAARQGLTIVTETEWLALNDPRAMLKVVQRLKPSERKVIADGL